MQKSISLSAKCITDGSSLLGVLNGGSDYRTVDTRNNSSMMNPGLYVGVIGFDTSEIANLSSACTLTGVKLTYQQRVNPENGLSGSASGWRLRPYALKTYQKNGTSLSVSNSAVLGGEKTTTEVSDNWKDKTADFSLTNASAFTFGRDMLGVSAYAYLTYKYAWQEVHMRYLSAYVTYTARYYARFYNENGALANEQLLEANEYASITEVMELLEKPGYDIRWWEIVEGEGKGQFVDYPRPSVDKDIGFKPYYVPKTYSIEVFPQRTDDLPGLYVEKKVNGAWNRLTPTRTRDYVGQVYAYYSGTYGDVIRFVADGYRSDQNLVISKNQGIPVEVVCTGQPITVDEKTVDGDYNVSIRQVQDIAFPISTSAGTGGTITAPQSVPRHGSADVVVTPDVGYELETVTIDDSTQEVDGTEPLTIPFADVTTAHSVSATFARIKIPIDLSGLPDGITVQGPNEVDYGSSQTWVFGCDSNHSLLTITVDDINLMAPVFKQVQSFPVTLNNITEPRAFGGTLTGELVTVAIQQTTGGTVTCDELPDGSGKFLPGVGALTFRATPNEYKTLVKWFNDAETETITLDVDENLTVSAVFENADVLTSVSITQNKGKVIITTPGPNYGKDISTVYLKVGESVDYEIVPDEGYRLSTSSNNYLYIETEEDDFMLPINSTTGRFEVGNVVSFHIALYRVSYRVSAYVLPPETDGLNQVVVSASVAFYNEPITISAIAAKHWYFEEWEGSSIPESVKYNPTISGLAQDIGALSPFVRSYTAVFLQYSHDIKTSAGAGGTITPSQSILGGSDLTVEITADYGFKIADVLLDGQSVFEDVKLTKRGGTYELKDIDASHSVEVQFGPRFFSHDRKLLDYYPPVIKSIYEIQALMAALQVQDAAMFDAASFIFENQFIESASVEGVSRWERELGIIPAPTDTLRQRKERLRIKWVPKPRFTMQWLRKWLETVCGQAVRDPVLTDYSLRVTLPGGVDWMTIFDDLKRYKPANIVLDPRVLMPRGRETLYVGTATMISNHSSPIIYTLDTRGD